MVPSFWRAAEDIEVDPRRLKFGPKLVELGPKLVELGQELAKVATKFGANSAAHS